MTNMSVSNDRALIGVSLAIKELIINQNFEQALDHALQYLGEAFDGDVFISELTLTADKRLVLNLKHHWMKVYDQHRLDINTEKPLTSFPTIYDQLAVGNTYTFKKSEATPELAKHLNLTGGQSGVLVPIFVSGNLWGLLSLTTIEYERDWSEAIVSVFDSLSCAIGAILSKMIYRASLEHEIIDQSMLIMEQNKRYETLVKNIPGIVFRCDMNQDWTMRYISPYVKELTGYADSDFVGAQKNKSLADLIHPNDRDFLWTETNRQLKKGTTYKVNYRIIDASGREHWIWEQGAIQANSHGEEMLEGCMIDITDRVRTHEKVMAATLEAEDRARTHFSEEIHDHLQQVLTTAHLNLEYAKKNRLNSDSKKHLDVASDSLQEAISATRSISHRLMPKTIEDYGYQAAVESLIEDLEGVIATRFEFHVSHGMEDIPTSICLSLYRITQEAITNIVKYAEASVATIQLIQHDDTLILTIDDNGKGFDYQKVLDAERGFGLNNMQNRATSIGGQLYIDSVPGKGTHLLMEIPYQTKKAKNVEGEDQNSFGR
ncbi:PAS domain-containing protein [Reichenbachiella agarivorans]|uniref:histidine kinase n=1 Tax=Reichenbachiella agarivorans TaxID=2979464 RepID=A0ABY6CMI3_9BACT|nr:PAS domain-containing protein [Reichenbachiella agarivorans]UXP31728.1 PAS domain-containing protein [Reichenbachiella agarivorans]